jgi:hypothetical protein
MKHNNSDSQLAAALNKPVVMQGLELNLPSMGEVSDAIEMLAKKSTAPDAETPDWLKADIRNGINWALNYVTKHNTSPAVGNSAAGQSGSGGLTPEALKRMYNEELKYGHNAFE